MVHADGIKGCNEEERKKLNTDEIKCELTFVKEFFTFFSTVNLHVFIFLQKSLAKLSVGFLRWCFFMWINQGHDCYTQHTCLKPSFLRSLRKKACCSRLKYDRAKGNFCIFFFHSFWRTLRLYVFTVPLG